MTELLKPRNYYKPFEYPWAYDLWKKHEAMHWLPQEVALHEDVRDWKNKLTKEEKNLLTNLFRFFTQADVDVAGGYTKKFLPYFSHKPELAMMMASFAAREAIHIDAYSTLLETLGMPESTYKEFQDFAEMKAKHDYVETFGMKTNYDVLKTLAVYSAFTEGVQLFGSFVILLNFSRFNKMKNMSNIVAWSIRDEDLHVEGMTTLFKEMSGTIIKADMVHLEEEIKPIALEMVGLELGFIDLLFKDSKGVIEGLFKEDVHQYIRFLANKRWKQLGFKSDLYPKITKNPLPWVDHIINGVEHTNFFEQKATAYAKAMTRGTMEEIEW